MNVGVIGAGIFGITAALELRSRQHEITVFEQGKIPQQDASSTDVSKSIRRDGYGPTYFELVERAAAKWKMWHEQLSKAIYYQTGKFRIARNFEPGTQAYEGWQFLTDRGAKIQLLSRQEARERFPQFTYYEEDTCFFYDPWAGYLRSGQAVEDLAGLARDEDVQIHEETGITQLKEGTSGVQVFFEGGSAQFDRVVIATGVWMNRLVPQIGKHMSLTRQEMAFFEPVDASLFAPESFPTWSVSPEADGWYGFPLLPEGFVKIANDRLGEHVDPDVDRRVTGEFLESVKEFAANRIPALAKGKLVGSRSCLYANTLDRHFVIDWRPGSQRILVAGGGSGHGFKFGGSIGEVIADALEEKANPLGDLFRIGNRFDSADQDVSQADSPNKAVKSNAVFLE